MVAKKLFYKYNTPSPEMTEVEDKEYKMFRGEVGTLIRVILDEKGKHDMIMGDDALDEITKELDKEVSDLFRRGNVVRKLGDEKNLTVEHVNIAKYSNELLHNECNSVIDNGRDMSLLHGGDFIDVLMAEDDAEVEKGGDGSELKKGLSRQEAIALERRKHNYQLLIQHRKRVSENAQFIINARLKKPKLV